MTTIFAFDTATSWATCALVRDGEAIGERLAEPRLLLVAAAELTRSARVGLDEIDALVVGVGPGSFTSIRVGLAAARALSYGLGVPVAGASTLEAFAGGTPVIDAKRGEVFTAGPSLSRPEELDVVGLRLVGDGAVRYRALFEAAGGEVPPDDDPAHRPAAALLVAGAGPFGDAEAVEPLYLRPPDAVPASR